MISHKEAQKNLQICLFLLWLIVSTFFTGCKRLVTEAVPPRATASATDGTFYVAWVNHDAKQADVMLARFSMMAETKISELGKAGSRLSVGANAELPASAVSNDKVFVAYIAKEKEKRSIWLVKVG